jgi:probable rRNA maturation factor
MKPSNSHPISTTQKATRKTGFCPVSIHKSGRGRYPQLAYDDIKCAILGNSYDLSIAFVSYKDSESLHIQYKHTDGPANILSFPLTDDSGEIILHLPTVYAKSTEYDHTPRQHLIFLIIHGMLHLLGHTHGSAMEKLERHWMEQFGQL